MKPFRKEGKALCGAHKKLLSENTHLKAMNKKLTDKLVESEGMVETINKARYDTHLDREFWKGLAIKYRDERNTECTCGSK